jgi:hypothetical protein
MQRLSLETAVRNVGDFKRPTTMTSGQFHLKATSPKKSSFFNNNILGITSQRVQPVLLAL